MKNLFAALIVIIVTGCLLLSCSSEPTYEDGFDDGYDEGYFDAINEYEDDYSRGYADGYIEGKSDIDADEIIYYITREAEKYAGRESGWHPEDAWCLIEAYQNNEPFYEDGSMPSYQDYLDAINSIIYFYEYFYGGHYE